MKSLFQKQKSGNALAKQGCCNLREFLTPPGAAPSPAPVSHSLPARVLWDCPIPGGAAARPLPRHLVSPRRSPPASAWPGPCCLASASWGSETDSRSQITHIVSLVLSAHVLHPSLQMCWISDHPGLCVGTNENLSHWSPRLIWNPEDKAECMPQQLVSHQQLLKL